MTVYRIELAWPAEDRGNDGIAVSTALELVTSDQFDGERLEMTESEMRGVADMLRILEPKDICLRAIGPDKKSGDTRDFPFTHHMVIEDQDWLGQRHWVVTLVEDEAGSIVRPHEAQGF
jgi:hypothetical protein